MIAEGVQDAGPRAIILAVQESEPIQTGDVVRLKEDGTVMLVRTISGDTAYCVWFLGLQLRSGTFLLSNLENVSNERRPIEGSQPLVAPQP